MAGLPGYDAWLERPYQEAAAKEEAFEDWCEREGVDYDDPTAADQFQAWCDEQGEAEAEAWAEDRAMDDYLEARYESQFEQA